MSDTPTRRTCTSPESIGQPNCRHGVDPEGQSPLRPESHTSTPADTMAGVRGGGRSVQYGDMVAV